MSKEYSLDSILESVGISPSASSDMKFNEGIDYLRGRFGGDDKVNAVLTGLLELRDVDPLTGVGSRLTFENDFEDAYTRLDRNGVPFSIMIADVDNFKGVNDNYGHLVGDAVLKAVVSRIGSGMRRLDGVYRYAGDEFAGIFSGADEKKAFAAAEKALERVSSSGIDIGGDRSLTASLSVGVYAVGLGDNFAGAVSRADKAMYRAKNSGKGRVSL